MNELAVMFCGVYVSVVFVPCTLTLCHAGGTTSLSFLLPYAFWCHFPTLLDRVRIRKHFALCCP